MSNSALGSTTISSSAARDRERGRDDASTINGHARSAAKSVSGGHSKRPSVSFDMPASEARKDSAGKEAGSEDREKEEQRRERRRSEAKAAIEVCGIVVCFSNF